MNLTLPTVGVTVGPTYATLEVSALTQIDSHNHTSGQGPLIPTAALNINGDLGFNGYNVSLLRAVRLTSQASPLALAGDVTCLYASGGNLYYNNGTGTQVQLTAGAALNAASIGAIGGDYATSSASVFYTSVASKFTFTSNTNTAAYMDTGPITLRQVVASANGVTITPPAGLSANYQLTLPSGLPATTNVMTLDSSGNVGYTTAPTLTAATITGAVTVGATLGVTGNATFGGTLSSSGAATLNSVVVTTTANIGGTLSTGNISAAGAVSVTGSVSATSTISSGGDFIAGSSGSTGIQLQYAKFQGGIGAQLWNYAPSYFSTDTLAIGSSVSTTQPIVVSAGTPANGVMTVRGLINWSGSAYSISAGEGFTLAAGSGGQVIVQWGAAFNVGSTTIATGSRSGGTPGFVSPQDLSTTQMKFFLFNTGGVAADFSFQFIAQGIRA